MVEFVPLALACGHIAEGWLKFELAEGEPPRVQCPEGCGLVGFVAEPGDLDEGDTRS
jgi:hypothetical protein